MSRSASATQRGLESTLQFATAIHDSLITAGKANIKAMALIWNMVDGRERSELYHAYDLAIEEPGLRVMQTVIPDSKRFCREMSEAHKPVFRSTLQRLDGKGVQLHASLPCG